MNLDEQIKRAFGKQLRKLRETKGWSQTDLGYEADVTPIYVSKIELGKANPSLVTVVKLAKALECKINELIEI